MECTIFLPHKIFTGNEWLTDKALLVKEGKIENIIAASEITDNLTVKRHPACFIAPAFIDVQIYGAHKKLLAVYPEPQTLALMNEYRT